MSGTRKLFLHIGKAKTGTTSLQNHLAAKFTGAPDPAPDPASGLWYLPRSNNRPAHHLLSAALMNKTNVAQTFGTALAPLAEAPPGTTAVISAEGLGREAPDAVLDAVFEALGPASPWEVWVIVYLRPHLSQITALYQQIVKAGLTTDDFEDFAATKPLRWTVAELATYQNRLDGRLIVRPFVAAHLTGGDTVVDFFTTLAPHLRAPVTVSAGLARENTSVSLKELVLLRHGWSVLGRGPDPQKRRLLKKFLRRLSPRVAGPPGKSRLAYGPALLAELQDTYHWDAHDLDAAYMPAPIFLPALTDTKAAAATTTLALEAHFTAADCQIITAQTPWLEDQWAAGQE